MKTATLEFEHGGELRLAGEFIPRSEAEAAVVQKAVETGFDLVESWIKFERGALQVQLVFAPRGQEPSAQDLDQIDKENQAKEATEGGPPEPTVEPQSPAPPAETCTAPATE